MPVVDRSLIVRRYPALLATAAVIVVADQLSKNWAESSLAPTGRAVKVALGVEFRFAQNQGMAFSRFNGAGPIIGLVAVVIVVGLLVFARTISSLPSRIIIGVVMGGALGNLIDRLVRDPAFGRPTGLLRGAVVDFIYTSWWPTFNIADASIVVGGILLAVTAWRAPVEPVDSVDAAPSGTASSDTA